MRYLLLLALAVLAAGVALAAPPPPVATALALLKNGKADLAAGWKYEERISGSHGSLRLSYDPSRAAGARWRVLAVNGKPPSEAMRKRLQAQVARAGQAGKSGLAVGSGWLAASDYRLVKTTAKTLVYQIMPRPGGGGSGTEKLLRHLAGRLVVSRDDDRPLSLSLDNFESFSPRFGVRIEAFDFHAEFRRLGPHGPIVVVRTSNSARGKVFWIKSFKDETEVRLSAFVPVTASAPTSTPVPVSSPGSQTSPSAGRN